MPWSTSSFSSHWCPRHYIAFVLDSHPLHTSHTHFWCEYIILACCCSSWWFVYIWSSILWAGRRSTWVVSGFLLCFPYPLPYCAGSSIVCVYRGSLVISRMASWVSCQYSDFPPLPLLLFSTPVNYTKVCTWICRKKISLLHLLALPLSLVYCCSKWQWH